MLGKGESRLVKDRWDARRGQGKIKWMIKAYS